MDKVFREAVSLILEYARQHPELAIVEKLDAEALLGPGEGAKLGKRDDGAGHYSLEDESGNVVLTLDLSSWVAPREP